MSSLDDNPPFPKRQILSFWRLKNRWMKILLVLLICTHTHTPFFKFFSYFIFFKNIFKK